MPCYAYRGITPIVDATRHVHRLAVLIGVESLVAAQA